MFQRLFAIAFLSLLCILSSCKQGHSLKSREGTIAVEGGNLWYKVIGEGSKPPILMMHGGPGGTHRNFYFLEPLSSDRSIILFDQLGTGRSGYHTDTTLMKVEKFVEQVYELKKSLNLTDYYLMGHSWGAALELEYFEKYPEGVKGIIFSSPYLSTPVWEADADTLIATLPDSIQTMIREAEAINNFNTPQYRTADSVYWSKFGNRHPAAPHPWDTIDAPGNRFMYNYMWGPSEFTARGTLKTYDNMEGLASVSVPVLFVTGEFDEARPATMKRFQQRIPNSHVAVVSDAGHSTMKDNLPELLQSIREFLDAVESEK
ncbi:proline iminopeptidase-family hydrolase [Robertkochia flava]|uniref:proline iminopeptidase-family hydrolase n=1 Tax=Robertkochia flava TaxID=3447986 RepID=UPI001CC8F33E|nr:proline iminopeptidase-family hydrolase [Robertkochia marina]